MISRPATAASTLSLHQLIKTTRINTIVKRMENRGNGAE